MIIGAMPPESQHRCHGVEFAYDRLSDIRRRGICLSGGLAASRSVHLSQCALSAGLAPSVSCGTGSLFGRPPISEGNLTRKPSGVAWPTVLRMRV